MTFASLMVLGGLIGLFLGGEVLLRGAVELARRAKMSELLIGLTIVGFGTSMPELLVSLEAALAGQPAIALGNVVGSNIANILLIGAISALIFPMKDWDNSVRRDAMVMILASFIVFGLALSGSLSRLNGVMLIAALLAYLIYAWRSQASSSEPAEVHTAEQPLWLSLGYLALGFVMLFVGANYLIEGSTFIARHFGVSEAVIGLTIVAVGTSLPELATSVIAAFKGKSDIAIGNIVGSNIFNILGILGITAVVAPITVDQNFSSFDIPVMIVVALVFALMLFFFKTIGRAPAIAMLTAYFTYVMYQFLA